MPPTLVPRRLRELIAALDRRLRQAVRAGDSAIRHDANALRDRAVAELQVLEPSAAAAAAAPGSQPQAAWQHVARGHNSLILGTPAATAAAVNGLLPRLRPEVIRRKPGQALDLAAGPCRTLILEDAETLSPPDQLRLAAWLGDEHRGVQVVSTAARPLYPLVERGAFDAILYYRLNVVCVEL